MISKGKLSVAWAFQLFLISGYFGASDNYDTDVLLPPHANVNFPPASSSSGTGNKGKGNSNLDVNTSNKLRMKRSNQVDTSHDEEMKLWDHIFANALATSNTSQWIHLRQIFDRVEEELHKTKSTGNTSLQLQLNKLHKEISSHRDRTFVQDPLSMDKKVVGPKHPKFSYHRVTSPIRGRGRPFAAVTLAVADTSTGNNANAADIEDVSGDAKTDQTISPEQDHFSADYQLDHHDVLLREDFSHLEKFDQSKFGGFQNFENFESFDGSSRDHQTGLLGGGHEGDEIPSAFERNEEHLARIGYRHHPKPNHQTRRRHHHHRPSNGEDHYLKRDEEAQQDRKREGKGQHHHRRRTDGKHHSTHRDHQHET